jgi:hypothetical protein
MISSGGSGLQLRDDGLLSGTAPAEGQYAITVSVLDDTRTVTSTLLLTVTADSSPLTISTSTLSAGVVQERYATILNAAGGEEPYVWTLVSNGGQPGLSLSAAGVLSGVPTLPGTFGLIFRVSDGTGTDQSALTLTISRTETDPEFDIPLAIATDSLPDANRVLYAAAMEARGGVQPYTWTGGDVSSPGTGFTVDATSGSLTGNSNELLPGQYGYSVTVTDSVDDSVTRSYVITVPGGDSPPVRIQTENPLPTAFESLFYTTILRAVGGTGGTLWSVIDTVGFPGTPPSFAGLIDAESGILTWNSVDVAQGNYLITIQVDDTSDQSSDVFTFDLQASAATVRITTDTELPGGVVGSAYSTVINAEGGGGTDTWSVVSVTGSASTTEPDFDSPADEANGTLTWPAPEEGTYTVTVKVVSEDGGGVASSDEKEFELEILPTT